MKDFGDDVTHVIVPHSQGQAGGAPRTLNYYLGVAAVRPVPLWWWWWWWCDDGDDDDDDDAGSS